MKCPRDGYTMVKTTLTPLEWVHYKLTGERGYICPVCGYKT